MEGSHNRLQLHRNTKILSKYRWNVHSRTCSDADIVVDKNAISLWDVIDRKVTFEKDIDRFRTGYELATDLVIVNKLIKKGLILKPEYQAKINSSAKWNKHVQHMCLKNNQMLDGVRHKYAHDHTPNV
eukprot:980779_1